MSSKPTMIKSQEREFTKTYSVYDVNGDLADFYIAHVNTPNNGECLYVRTTYDVNHRPVYAKEMTASWLTAWETF
jgi:hypothetical protein